MHPPEILESIYKEHGYAVLRMIGTLVGLDVPLEDVDLLSRMPWTYLANRIAVEHERLGLPAVYPLLHFKTSPPPPAWLTPAMCKKIFELALEFQDDEAAAEAPDGRGLVLPA